MNIFEYFKHYIKKSSTVQTQTEGVTGTETYGGYISEEFQDRLRDTRNRYEIYHRMRSESGVLNMCIKATRDSIRSSKWGFAIKEEWLSDSGAERQLEFMKKAFPVEQLERLVEDMTTAVTFGFYLGERYYKPFEFDGETKLRPMIKFISQRTVEQWATGEDSEIIGVIQRAYGDDVRVIEKSESERGIDGKNLLHYAVNQEGDNHEGISFLRPCYMNWLRKNNYYKQIATGTHFLAIPYLKVYQDLAIGQKPSHEQMQKLGEILANRARKDKVVSHIFFPIGFKAEEMQSGFNPETLYKCNAEEDQEMIRAFCCNFLLLTKGSGSFALSNDLSDFFMRGLEAIAAGMDTAIDKGLVRPTIYANFDEECMVELVHSEVGGKGGPKMAEALAKLLGSGAVKPDESLEKHVREVFGLPEIDFDTRQDTPAITPINGMGGDDTASSDSTETDLESDDDVDDAVDDSGDEMQMTSRYEGTTYASAGSMAKQADRSVKRLKKTKDKMVEIYKTETKVIIDKKLRKMRTFLRSNGLDQAQGKFKVEDIHVSPSKLQNEVFKVAEASFQEEYQDISGRLEMASKREVKMLMRQMSISDVNGVVDKLDAVMLTALYDALKTNDIELVLGIVNERATAFLGGKEIVSKATMLPAISINEARQYSFDSVRKEIESYTYYNSSPVADICKYLNGKTISVDDPDQYSYQPPLHYNCATVVVANMKHWKNKPNTEKLTPNKTQVASIQRGPKAKS